MESHPETITFCPDGVSLLTGSIDGFIEIWDFSSCKLRTDLEYQAKEELMMQDHSEAVLCCCFSTNNEIIASGSQAGNIKVFKITTGICLRKFQSAHSKGITSVSFAKDGTQLLTTSFDCTARIHGLKSGKTIKEFSGHASYVNCGLYTRDGSQIITGSSDGTCKVWDVKTTECVATYRYVLLLTFTDPTAAVDQSGNDHE
jgi:WD40 repeat-containing protein SMU1